MKTTRLLVPLLLIFAFTPLPLAAENLDWPHYHGPGQDGVSHETGWNTDWEKSPPPVLWDAKVGRGFASVAIVGNRLYTMGFAKGEDTVYCLNALSGETIWIHSYPSEIFDKDDQYGGGPCGTPTVAEGRVYTLSKLGLVHCLDAETGKVLWSRNYAEEVGSRPGRWGFSGSILIDGGRGFAELGCTVAFNPADGEILWKTRDYEAGYSTPTPMELNGERFVLVFNSHGLVALEPATGLERAVHPWPTQYGVNACIPQVMGNRIFISSDYGQGSALLEFDGKRLKPVWENNNLMTHFNTASIKDGFAYGFNGHVSREGDFRCIDLSTGELVWETAEATKGSNLLVDGKLVILTGNGELALAEPSPEGFQSLARFQALGGRCWTEPVFLNKRVYCRNSRGDLVCLDLSGAGTAG